ncbi:MAG: hypothetical protein A2X35_08645 [Elusimicrobia bacterium GWA2_61_42]|nr:MAG: hypothetical protein A2X35_08645 [Elusimicrobia bacterium GWA2_61_42]OGR77303.1 MAG: hypothetical protein A2X38_09195 [Elusimicrobia bacterium GWC2_61_25]
MPETEHVSFFRTHKVLAFLPLAVMGAGVWYYVNGRVQAVREEAAAPAALQEEPPAAARPRSRLPLPEAYNPELGLDVQGPPEFKSQVTHALKLIWMADRDTFLFLKKNLSVIRNENKTGFYLDGGRTVAALSSDHAFRSLTWCAGIIAHQAWHAWYELNTRKRTRRAPPPPGEADASVPEANPAKLDYKSLGVILETEDRAFAFQLAVLRKVGAPAKETTPVLRRAPKEFTLAHDGSYALNP